MQIKTTIRYHLTPIRMATNNNNQKKKPENKAIILQLKINYKKDNKYW